MLSQNEVFQLLTSFNIIILFYGMYKISKRLDINEDIRESQQEVSETHTKILEEQNMIIKYIMSTHKNNDLVILKKRSERQAKKIAILQEENEKLQEENRKIWKEIAIINLEKSLPKSDKNYQDKLYNGEQFE